MGILQQARVVSSNLEAATRSREFVSLMRFLHMGGAIPLQAKDYAEQAGASPAVRQILKDASAGTTVGTGWGAELAPLATAFLTTLKPFSAFDRMLPDFFPVPLKTRVAMEVAAATGTTVGEGSIRAISQIQFADQNVRLWSTNCSVTITDELARSPQPQAFGMIERGLQHGVSNETDRIFVSILTENTSVASVPSSGSIIADQLDDLDAAINAINLTASSKLWLITPPKFGARLMMLRDGSQLVVNGALFDGLVKLVASDALTTELILVDASKIAANAGNIIPRVSREGTLDMGSGATDHSLWQRGEQAVALDRLWACEPLATDAIAVITGLPTSVTA
jgi:hypothetical protein